MEDVLIVGAGPTGLVTAAELALAGVRCRVLERRAERSGWSRAFGLHARTLELLDARGLAEPLVARGYRSPEIRLDTRLVDLHRLPTRFPYLLIIPQNETEEVLEDAVRGMGVPVDRSAEVVDVRQEPNHVQVRVRDADGRVRTERARYLVAADGHRSTVRRLLGEPFPGSPYEMTVMLGDVVLKEPLGPQMQIVSTRRGMVLCTPFRDGHHRVITIDHRFTDVPVGEPLSLLQLASSTRYVSRRTLGFVEARWLSRFSSHQRQAPRYRVDRVFLVGDAAHVHSPAGGQGLNTGVQDAVNLGWKLAAAVRGWAPEWLLDSYHEERHPVGADVLRRTDLMLRAMSLRARPARAMRKVGMATALSLPLLHRRVREGMAMTSLAYPARGPEQHSWAGRPLPDEHLVTAEGRVSPYHLLRDGRFLLVTTGWTAAGGTAGYEGRVRAVATAGLPGPDWPAVVLVRPDGYVAAASGTVDDVPAMLGTWCGTPRTAATPLG
ncbi:FAD-dependent monooxygenase [Streptomyces sp. 7R007]